MHVYKGSYSGVVYINWATVSTNTDPVFTIPVKPNTMYEYSVWIYIDKTDPMEYINQYCGFIVDQNAPYGIDIKNNKIRGEWQQLTFTFTTGDDQHYVSTSLNANTDPLSFWFDDIQFREIKPGVLENTEETYCEELRNIISDDVISAIESGKSGKYKVDLLPSEQYVFGVELSASKTTNSRIFLSEDGITPMNASAEGATNAVITTNKSSVQRYGYRFLSPAQGYVYIVVENDDGALNIGVPQMFKNHLITTLYSYGMDYNPNTVTQKRYDTLKELNTNTDGYQISGEQSPSTGSGTVLPIVVLAVTTLLTVLVLWKLKGRCEQE